MNHLKSAFYVFTWAFVFGFLMMLGCCLIFTLIFPWSWRFVIDQALLCGSGCAVINTFIHGKPLDNGDVYNPWRFTLLRSK